MARTTLDLDGTVARELRRRAEQDGKSMGRVASELLAGALAEPPPDDRSRPFEWIERDLGAPKLDLEDKEALHTALDGSA
jgi:hypothetical protein